MTRRDQGFALLLVLWSLVLLTLVTTRLIATGRDDARLAQNLRAAAAAEMLADAAIHEAMFHLLDQSDAGWLPGGPARTLQLAGGTAVITTRDQAGLVNPNKVQLPLLVAMLRAAGASTAEAGAVATNIMDWRFPTQGRTLAQKAAEYRAAGRDYAPPEAPFRDTQELGLVLGVTPALLAILAPNLSVTADGEPGPRLAPPLVLQALRQAGAQPATPGQADRRAPRIVAITADVTATSGSRFIRQAIARLGTPPSPGGAPYQILTWQRLVTPP